MEVIPIFFSGQFNLKLSEKNVGMLMTRRKVLENMKVVFRFSTRKRRRSPAFVKSFYNICCRD